MFVRQYRLNPIAQGQTILPTRNNDDSKPDSSQTDLLAEQQLKADVEHLAVTIGERNQRRYKALNQAADWIQTRFRSLKLKVRRETYQVHGRDQHNIEATSTGSEAPNEIVVVGAHYDTSIGTPGANDNGSGVASMLRLAERLSKQPHQRTIRFVAFTNEEPPLFQTDEMGSTVYAKGCRRREENLVAVLSLETMGYFTDSPGSQKFPSPLLASRYPDKGNFIGFIGNLPSRPLTTRSIQAFRKASNFPCESASLPSVIPGIGWSDHWSFWQEDYQAVMITDTAPFRYPHYHKLTDLPDKIDFESLAQVVEGLEQVILDLASL